MAKMHSSNHRSGPHRALIQCHSRRRHQPREVHDKPAPLLGALLACSGEGAVACQASEAKGAELPTKATLLPTRSPSAPALLGREIFWVRKKKTVCAMSQNLSGFGPFRAKLLRGSWKGKERCRIQCQAAGQGVSPAPGLGVTYMLMSVMHHPRSSCQLP